MPWRVKKTKYLCPTCEGSKSIAVPEDKRYNADMRFAYPGSDGIGGSTKSCPRCGGRGYVKLLQLPPVPAPSPVG